MKTTTVLTLGLSLMLSIAQVQAASRADSLSLRGSGTATYLMFDVYDAQLFAPRELAAERLLDPNVPRALVLRYKVSIQREQIIEASEKTLREQWPEPRLNRIRAELQALYASMRDVAPGDEYRLDYQPGEGLRLSLNRREVWRGGDAELASMYFGIWLREPALSEDLRKVLLGSD